MSRATHVRKGALVFVFFFAVWLATWNGQSTLVAASAPRATAAPSVIAFTAITAETAAAILRRLYPKIRIAVDREANALIVIATPDQLEALRQVAAAIDVKNPLTPITQAFTLHRFSPALMAQRLSPIFKEARFSAISRRQLLVSASSVDMQQIQSLIGSLDAAPATPAPAVSTAPDTEAVRLYQARPKDVAREVAGAVRNLRVAIAGQSIVLAGSPDAVTRAKDLIAVLDSPPAGTRYTAVYRIRTLDAQSVADLIARSFPNAKVTADEEINSLSVMATAAEQRRIADGIAQLDTPSGQNAPGAQGAGVAAGPGSVDIYTLKAALPNANGAQSTSANDLATIVTQALQPQAPDLHVSVAPNAPQLVLTGNPYSIKLAKDLLGRLDVPQELVALDTEILEMDENTAKNLGIQATSIFGGPLSFGAIFVETTPPPDFGTGVTPPLKRLQGLTRSPIGFGVQLNLAIEHGLGRVLADPRITTLSGHTATIRAGDNLSIQLQAGGGIGTVATTQIQTFQTGVTLDITPIVNADGLITVALHPVVNSLTGLLNGIPQISTRDTQTTVALREDQTLVIGGLIQDDTQRIESRIPFLGDLPLLGHLFRNETLNGNRNELIITVTPHILKPGENTIYPGPPLPSLPTPAPLPTIMPGVLFPSARPLLQSNAVQTPQRAAARILHIAAPTFSPSPSPAAAQHVNAFIYGSPQANNYAAPGDPVQIYYVAFSPTSLSYGTPVQFLAITSSNVATLNLSYNAVSSTIPSTGSGQWQASFPFTLVGMPETPGSVTLVLTASRADGVSVTVPIPVTIVPRLGSQQSASLENGF